MEPPISMKCKIYPVIAISAIAILLSWQCFTWPVVESPKRWGSRQYIEAEMAAGVPVERPPMLGEVVARGITCFTSLLIGVALLRAVRPKWRPGRGLSRPGGGSGERSAVMSRGSQAIAPSVEPLCHDSGLSGLQVHSDRMSSPLHDPCCASPNGRITNETTKHYIMASELLSDLATAVVRQFELIGLVRLVLDHAAPGGFPETYTNTFQSYKGDHDE